MTWELSQTAGHARQKFDSAFHSELACPPHYITQVVEKNGAQGRIRTTDTRIFSPLLYQLSYLGPGPSGLWRAGSRTYANKPPGRAWPYRKSVFPCPATHCALRRNIGGRAKPARPVLPCPPGRLPRPVLRAGACPRWSRAKLAWRSRRVPWLARQPRPVQRGPAAARPHTRRVTAVLRG